MCPACSAPSRLPAPRISRSFSATCMPLPSSLLTAMVVEPVVRGLGERLLLVVQEVRVRALAAAADAAAQLVQLREAVLVGAVDDDRVRVGDVEAGLDDRRRDEHVELALPEVDDDLLEHVLAHLAVRDGDARLGHELGELRRDALDRLRRGCARRRPGPRAAARGGSRRRSACRCAGPTKVRIGCRSSGGVCERRHLADAGDGHLERARDRRRAHREDVDVGLQLLQRVLVLDAEALLLVDDEQARGP